MASKNKISSALCARAACAPLAAGWLIFLSILASPVLGQSAVTQSADTRFASVESSTNTGYVLGAGDVLMVTATDIDELEGNDLKPSTIDIRGNIDVPLIGSTKAAGFTVDQLESELDRRLGAYVRTPQATVTVVEYRSQPVSVLGSVNTPGVYFLTGSNTLEQLISKAGGLRLDAGNTINITRQTEMGLIPLPSDIADSSGKFNTASVPVHALLEAHDPQNNVLLKPTDVISVPKAELVYVMGSVNKPGGFVLDEKPNLSVVQAVAMAEGLGRTSAGKHARIIRQGANGSHTEIPVDLNKILAGKAPDVPMFGRDILFVPNSKAKSAAYRGAEAAIATGTGLAIFR
jgi:polysaccharide export outer membrane protein